MVIIEMKDSDRPTWDAYIRQSANGLPHLLSGWYDVIKETYHFENCFLMAAECEQVLLDKNIRRQIRMANKNELFVKIDRSGDLLDDLYSVLSRFSHASGTPLFEKNFLRNVINTFPGGFNIVVTYCGKQPICGNFQLEMGNTVYGIWGACLHEFLHQRATYLSYWKMLVDTAEKGFQYLDMGRSPVDTNTSAFKGQWGGVSSPIYQQVVDMGLNNHRKSLTNQIHSDSKFRLFVRVWSKPPFPVVQYLGPRLRRHVPFA